MYTILLILLPIIIVIAHIYLKAMQTPVNKTRRAQLTTKEHARLFYWAFIHPKKIKPFPTNKQQPKKLLSKQRKWIQIGRMENEMKHIKARYKRFKEYSQTMPSEDIEISQKEISKELKRYKSHRKELIRQALMSSDE